MKRKVVQAEESRAGNSIAPSLPVGTAPILLCRRNGAVHPRVIGHSLAESSTPDRNQEFRYSTVHDKTQWLVAVRVMPSSSNFTHLWAALRDDVTRGTHSVRLA